MLRGAGPNRCAQRDAPPIPEGGRGVSILLQARSAVPEQRRSVKRSQLDVLAEFGETPTQFGCRVNLLA
jgi:hypothetical protein